MSVALKGWYWYLTLFDPHIAPWNVYVFWLYFGGYGRGVERRITFVNEFVYAVDKLFVTRTWMYRRLWIIYL
ncbi:hypothetical protein CIPAW_03G269500 [Carya illinoinensis]|uniref:Uncharacterized protein n=1 Tax=Carya illinoinensis TaxID=32201 RepID=A0A8T1R7F9_CARIL|nr:hypothetical protein CIPAW_03G269500 [Carya illinoinensis]